MSFGKRQDPYLDFRFLVEVDQLIKGGFTQVSGLQAEVDIEEYREGGTNDFFHHLPRGTKYPYLSLKRGLIDHSLGDWHQKARNGQIERKTVWVIVLDMQGNEEMRWAIRRAFPVRWLGPEFKANSNSVAVESMELVHQGIEKV
jgi:phage tail-like protein